MEMLHPFAYLYFYKLLGTSYLKILNTITIS